MVKSRERQEMARPWISARRTLRKLAENKHSGCIARWVNGRLYFMRTANEKVPAPHKLVPYELVPGIPPVHKPRKNFDSD